MRKRIYLDHAATTPVSDTVLETMIPFFREFYGNASAVYETGRKARKAVEKARKQVADSIGAEPGEIQFTSGGSESDNTAIKGTAFALKEKGCHIITSAVEHPAVLNTCGWLEKHGFQISYIQPDQDGRIDPEKIRSAIRRDTILISVMAANNEIGTIQPVDRIGKIAHEHRILFHTDAVQAIGSLPVQVEDIHADLMTISAHKFNGPKGTGALYIRRGTRIDSQIHGGEQERGLRAGTENVPGIAGMGKAIEEAVKHLDGNSLKTRRLRDQLLSGILTRIPGACLNGPEEGRLSNNCNVRFDGIDGEALLLRLDLAGIDASGGSACTSGSRTISHVLTAIGLTEAQAKGSIRLTPGPENTEEEIEEAIRTIAFIVNDLRTMNHT